MPLILVHTAKLFFVMSDPVGVLAKVIDPK